METNIYNILGNIINTKLKEEKEKIEKEKLIKSIFEIANALSSFDYDGEAKKFYNIIGTNQQKITVASSKPKINYDELKILNKETEKKCNDLILFIDPFANETEKLINFIKVKQKIRNKSLTVLLSGRPGIGKTTYVKYIAKKTNKDLLILKASRLISSFLGETQKNIDFLLDDLKIVNSQAIILIDEMDSLLGSRENSINDEYKRMVGSFNMMLDRLPSETILIGSTNMDSLIDEAIKRRFNIKIDFYKTDRDKFLNLLEKKGKNIGIKLDKKLLIKILFFLEKFDCNIENILTFAMVDELITNYDIFEKNIYLEILNLLNKKILKENFVEMNTDFLDKNNFSTNEIAKILDKDYRTIKKKIV